MVPVVLVSVPLRSVVELAELLMLPLVSDVRPPLPKVCELDVLDVRVPLPIVCEEASALSVAEVSVFAALVRSVLLVGGVDVVAPVLVVVPVAGMLLVPLVVAVVLP